MEGRDAVARSGLLRTLTQRADRPAGTDSGHYPAVRIWPARSTPHSNQ